MSDATGRTSGGELSKPDLGIDEIKEAAKEGSYVVPVGELTV